MTAKRRGPRFGKQEEMMLFTGPEESKVVGPKVTPWTVLACQAWEDRFGKATAPGGRIGAALKPLVQEHGADVVLEVWRRYASEKDPQFANPQDFRMRFDHYRVFGARKFGAQEQRQMGNVQAAVDFINGDE